MTAKQIAEALNGLEYPFDISKELRDSAKEAGILIVYGASDDLIEFDGAWKAERYVPGTVYLSSTGIVEQPGDEEIKILRKYGVIKDVNKGAASIEAIWVEPLPDGKECSWQYKVSFPHETFDVMEDGEIYCRGIVFYLSDAIKPAS